MAGFKINIDKIYTDTIPQVLFLFAIVVDSINGYAQEFMNLHLPIGVIFRGALLLLLFSKGFYVRNYQFNLLFRIMTVVYLVLMLAWTVLSYYFSLTKEFNILFRFVYFFVVVFYFYNYRNYINKQKLMRYIVWAAFLIACLNIFCYITDTGIKSYDEDFGFGTKAFYADGNSIGLYMVLSLYFSIWYAYYRGNFWNWLMVIVISVATILIGTRAALFGTLAGCVVLPLSFVFFSDGIIRTLMWKKLAIVVTIAAVVSFVIVPLLMFVANFDTFNMQRFTGESILSPRDMLIQDGKEIINSYENYELVIGNGASGGLKLLGQDSFSDSGMKSIEADFYDQILYYGWVFGTLMIVINLMLLWQFVRSMFRRFNSLTYTVAIIGCVWMLASYMAGHGFFNIMLAPLFGALLVIVSAGNYDSLKVK